MYSLLNLIKFSGLPCLSFDVITDDLGTNRGNFPHTMYLVAGSQAEKPKDNCVIVMKVLIYRCEIFLIALTIR